MLPMSLWSCIKPELVLSLTLAVIDCSPYGKIADRLAVNMGIEILENVPGRVGGAEVDTYVLELIQCAHALPSRRRDPVPQHGGLQFMC